VQVSLMEPELPASGWSEPRLHRERNLDSPLKTHFGTSDGLTNPGGGAEQGASGIYVNRLEIRWPLRIEALSSPPPMESQR